MILHRRKLLTAGAGLVGTALLGGCDRFAGTDTGQRTLKVGEDANLYVQRLLMSPATLAPGIPGRDDLPLVQAERHHRPAGPGLSRPRGEQVRGFQAGGRRAGRRRRCR